MKKSLQRIKSLSRIIFLDGIRRYALMGLLLLSLLAEASGLLFMDFFSHDIGRASSDFLFSIMWGAGLLFILFHAVQVIAWDEEKGVIYALLSRPISREEYVIGVFVGLAFLLLCLQLLLGTVAYATLTLIKYNLDVLYFPSISISYFILSWSGLMAMQWVLLAAVLMFSSMVRGGFPVLLLTVAYYGICSGLPVVRASVSQQLAFGQDVSMLANLLQAITAVFPDFSRLDFKDNIVSSQPFFEAASAITDFSVSGLYIALAVAFACFMYAKRDLQ